jgi:hypothetical protein
MNADQSDKEFYNLLTDPGEKNNLAETEKEKTEELAKKLIEWRKTMPVEMVVNR